MFLGMGLLIFVQLVCVWACTWMRMCFYQKEVFVLFLLFNFLIILQEDFISEMKKVLGYFMDPFLEGGGGY